MNPSGARPSPKPCRKSSSRSTSAHLSWAEARTASESPSCQKERLKWSRPLSAPRRFVCQNACSDISPGGGAFVSAPARPSCMRAHFAQTPSAGLGRSPVPDAFSLNTSNHHIWEFSNALWNRSARRNRPHTQIRFVANPYAAKRIFSFRTPAQRRKRHAFPARRKPVNLFYFNIIIASLF